MKIKKSLLLLSISSVAIFSAAAVLFAHNSKASKLFAGGDEVPMGPTRSITFDGSTLTPGAYSSGTYTYPLSFHGDKVIGDTYDVDSYEASIYCTEGVPKFKQDGKIATFISEGYEAFTVYFMLEKRAIIDEDSSVIDMHVNGLYRNSFIEEYDSDDEYVIYKYSATFYSDHGKSVVIDAIHLVFACPL